MGEEMKYSLEYYFYFFSGFYLAVYVFPAIILLIGTTFLKGKYKTESYNFLYVFNTLVAWCAPLGLGFYLIELFVAWYGQNPYEWYAFHTDSSYVPITWPWIIIHMAVPLFLGLLFFFRKLRVNRWYILIFLLFLNLGSIEKQINNLWTDYKPATWSTGYHEPYHWQLFGMIIFFLVVIYFIAKKKNKLPYPSVFLK
jgi:hypothetical protein